MRTAAKQKQMDTIKKSYQKPSVEVISLDSDISLVMNSPPPPNPQMPQMPGNWPEGIVQKIFKFGW